jgi:hypothetical protein
MDSCLEQKIPIQLPVWQPYSRAPNIPGFTEITSITPILKTFLDKPIETEGQFKANEYFGRVVEFSGSGGSCVIETVARKKRKVYCKVSHILDPIRTMQGFYKKELKGAVRKEKKINNPMNQAYVDALANYLLGQLRERNISPHFCLYYGGFQGIADKYRYCITDDFETYRKYKGFWEKRKAGNFKLVVEQKDDDGETVSTVDEEIEDYVYHTPKSSLQSHTFTYSTKASTYSSHISLTGEEKVDLEVSASALGSGGIGVQVELESLPSLESEGLPELEEQDSTEDSNDEEEEEDEGWNIDVYAEFENYPTVLIFQEENKGVMDDLLEEENISDEREEDWEDRWTAWTFQIIAALCAAQGVLGFTHNDLHTNNIVWEDTDQSWIFYKDRAGEVWRIPTYGKLFRIIDFGRAIFRVGEKWFISDDYEEDGDAEGQYNFGPFQKKEKDAVYPNPSFDLCRYSVSILEGLFPERPEAKADGLLLSKEGDWEVRETEHPLFNLLWSWLIDDEGKNVLQDEDYTERFPDFDLYSHISCHVFSAKPQEQITKDIFKNYKVKASEIGDWETIYPLFC